MNRISIFYQMKKGKKIKINAIFITFLQYFRNGKKNKDWIAHLAFAFFLFFFFARVCETVATVHILFNEQ